MSHIIRNKSGFRVAIPPVTKLTGTRIRDIHGWLRGAGATWSEQPTLPNRLARHKACTLVHEQDAPTTRCQAKSTSSAVRPARAPSKKKPSSRGLSAHDGQSWRKKRPPCPWIFTTGATKAHSCNSTADASRSLRWRLRTLALKQETINVAFDFVAVLDTIHLSFRRKEQHSAVMVFGHIRSSIMVENASLSRSSKSSRH